MPQPWQMTLHEIIPTPLCTMLKATRECFLVAQGYSWMSEWNVEKDTNRMPGIAWNCFSRNSWSTIPEEERQKVLTEHGKSEGVVGLHIHEVPVTYTPLKGNTAAFLPLFKDSRGYAYTSLMALWDQGASITGIVQIKEEWKYIKKPVPIWGNYQ